jgi:hypothetical protein
MCCSTVMDVRYTCKVLCHVRVSDQRSLYLDEMTYLFVSYMLPVSVLFPDSYSASTYVFCWVNIHYCSSAVSPLNIFRSRVGVERSKVDYVLAELTLDAEHTHHREPSKSLHISIVIRYSTFILQGLNLIPSQLILVYDGRLGQLLNHEELSSSYMKDP